MVKPCPPDHHPDLPPLITPIKPTDFDQPAKRVYPGEPRIPDEKGMKHDTGKPRTDLLPFDALLAVAEVQRFGAELYGDRNWERGMSWGRLLGAALRHLFKFAMGKNFDPESGLPHLAHAACTILFLLAYFLRGIGTDDLSTHKWREQ